MSSRYTRIFSVVTLYVMLLAGTVFGQAPGAAPPADAYRELLRTGRSLYTQQRYDEARTTFRNAVKLRKKSAPAHYWLGRTYYEQQQYKQAVRELKEAIRRDRKSPAAYISLGRTYMHMKHRRVEGRQTLKDALRFDPDNDEVYYELGRSYIDQSKNDVMAPLLILQGRRAFQKATVLNPNHPDAAYQLGLTYEYPGRDYHKAMSLYYRQLLATPDHRDALEHLGKSCFLTGQYLEGVDLLKQLINIHGRAVDPQVYTMMAQLNASDLQSKRQYARALKIYDEYLEGLDPKERAFYKDLKYVASPREYKKYQTASDEEKQEIWKKFWATRDPDPVTEVNERLVEHYRRVMYARENFSRSRTPWDRRGDIYIRYGAPDDRQHFLLRAGEDAREVLKPTGNARVDAIRERNRQLRYRLDVDTGGVRPLGISDEFEESFDLPDGRVTPEVGRGYDQFRLQAARENQSLAFVAESWVYVQYDLELYFVDQLGLGKFDYPLLGHYTNHNRAHRQARYHPRILADALIKKTPESYRYDYGGDPLDFIFDMVTYKGTDGRTQVEVAYEVPLRQLGDVSDGQGLKTWFDSHVVLRDADLDRVASVAKRVGPLERPLSRVPKKKVGVDLRTASLSLRAPPGVYQSAVEVRDEATRRIGIFEMPLTVADYTVDTLSMSGIKLANSITPHAGAGAFIRHGLRIDPNPSHIFPRSNPVHFYYEIYNLTKDDAGRTAYRTELEIIPKKRRMNIVWRILAGLGNLVKRKDSDRSVLLTFEDEGASTDEHKFTSIDTQESPTGPYTLRLTVTDRHTGRITSKTTEFVVADPVAPWGHEKEEAPVNMKIMPKKSNE